MMTPRLAVLLATALILGGLMTLVAAGPDVLAAAPAATPVATSTAPTATEGEAVASWPVKSPGYVGDLGLTEKDFAAFGRLGTVEMYTTPTPLINVRILSASRQVLLGVQTRNEDFPADVQWEIYRTLHAKESGLKVAAEGPAAALGDVCLVKADGQPRMFSRNNLLVEVEIFDGPTKDDLLAILKVIDERILRLAAARQSPPAARVQGAGFPPGRVEAALGVERPVVRAGDPVVLTLTIQNTETEEVDIFIPMEETSYRVWAVLPDGRELPGLRPERYTGALSGVPGNGFETIPAGGSWTRPFLLADELALTAPGKYTVVLRAHFTIGHGLRTRSGSTPRTLIEARTALEIVPRTPPKTPGE
jgi:hypothetical protein